jgi:hypothetical protein
VIEIQEIAELAVREGCYNTPLPCPDPIVWLVVGVIVGLWAASSIWLAYIRGLKDKEDVE